MLPIPYALDALNFLWAYVRNLFGPYIVFLVTARGDGDEQAKAQTPAEAAARAAISRFSARSPF